METTVRDVEVTPLTKVLLAYFAQPSFRGDVDARGICRDGVLVVSRADLVSGRAVARMAWGPDDVLELTGRPGCPSYLLRIPDEVTAKACLRALRLDADHVRTTHVLPWCPFGRVDGSGLLLLLTVVSALTFSALFLAGLDWPRAEDQLTELVLVASLALHLALWIYLRRHLLVRLEIGHDGLALTGGLRQRTREVPFADLAAVRPWPIPAGPIGSLAQGVDLVVRGGPPVRLYTRSPTNLGRVDEVVRAIDEAWTRYREPREEAAPEAEARLARADREVEEWAADLHRLGRGATGFREFALGPEELLAVLHNQAAPGEARAAAAYALTAAPEPELHLRVRVAAEAVASPVLREALEMLASGDDDQRMNALRRLRGEGGQTG